jgi:hypothetical protein
VVLGKPYSPSPLSLSLFTLTHTRSPKPVNVRSSSPHVGLSRKVIVSIYLTYSCCRSRISYPSYGSKAYDSKCQHQRIDHAILATYGSEFPDESDDEFKLLRVFFRGTLLSFTPTIPCYSLLHSSQQPNSVIANLDQVPNNDELSTKRRPQKSFGVCGVANITIHQFF